MLTVSVPDDSARSYLGDLPADVELLVWDGVADPPEGVERITFFVAPYNVTTPPDPAAFARMPDLRVVQLLSAGFEKWLPAVPDDVVLCNGRGVHGASTAELAVAGTLALLRDLPAYRRAQEAHEWDRRPARSLAGSRVLVIGAGDVGSRIATIAGVLEADVTVVAHTARDGVHAFDELPDLLSTQDVVVLAVPLTDETRSLADARFLAALPDGAVVANVARGAVVDTAALLAELSSRRLFAFLDVVDPEPLPSDHPLWDAPNLLLTPHIAGGVIGWQRRAYDLVHEQVLRVHDGRELANRVERPAAG